MLQERSEKNGHGLNVQAIPQRLQTVKSQIGKRGYDVEKPLGLFHLRASGLVE
jgi:hypothetical protein